MARTPKTEFTGGGSGLQLHRWYGVEDAIAACGGGAARPYCDGQFAVLPNAVLCIIAMGSKDAGGRAETPSRIAWVANRPDQRLPKDVTDVRSTPGGKRVRHPHLLLRARDGDPSRYFYAGQAHLASFTSGPAPAATFDLSHRLPWDVWLQLGGYAGWLVEVNHKPHRVAQGDRTAFERLAVELTATKYGHLHMTRYEEDSLTVYTNANGGFLMYMRSPDGWGYCALDPAYQGAPDAMETFKCTCGIELEYPASNTLPHNHVVQAAVEFFTTGELPDWIKWVELDATYKTGKT